MPHGQQPPRWQPPGPPVNPSNSSPPPAYVSAGPSPSSSSSLRPPPAYVSAGRDHERRQHEDAQRPPWAAAGARPLPVGATTTTVQPTNSGSLHHHHHYHQQHYRNPQSLGAPAAPRRTGGPPHPYAYAHQRVSSDLAMQQPLARDATAGAERAARQGDGQPRPPAQPQREGRPILALSKNILDTYRCINNIFYMEGKMNSTRHQEHPHYPAVRNEVVASRYVILECVGRGTFGTVFRCIDKKWDQEVALKMVRSGSYFEKLATFECYMVHALNSDESLSNLVVQIKKVFRWREHVALVFEKLSSSLYQLVKLTKNKGISLDLVRKFAYQVLKVLAGLEQKNPPVIHSDLKPENVLLKDEDKSGIRVIDFGSACFQKDRIWVPPPPLAPLPTTSPSADSALPGCPVHGEASASPEQNSALDPSRPDIRANFSVGVDMARYVQSRFYRAPEVILELGYTTAIDRWSLGCMLVELHTGKLLFGGRNGGDMVRLFTSILGPLPDYMIGASPKQNEIYNVREGDLSLPPVPGHAQGSPFFLRDPLEVSEIKTLEEVLDVQGRTAATPLSSPNSPPHQRGSSKETPGTYAAFVDFIKGLLTYDPRKRLRCADGLQHPFLASIRRMEAQVAAATGGGTALPTTRDPPRQP